MTLDQLGRTGLSSTRVRPCHELAREALASCLNDVPIADDVLRRLIDDDAGPVLCSVVAEGLSDRFEPVLCDRYAELFSRVMAMVRRDVDAPTLIDRHRRLGRTRVLTADRSSVASALRQVFAAVDELGVMSFNGHCGT